ncbi:ComEC/Rec2-like protein [Anaerofustis stercorihominis DSM 17244]|uniref:ComEC/Rec2-like protein n=3 Tax=Anaerofustis stercorihominis TaxID=214853 RepID=B1CAY3_9FIRM|nr:ComEC/Rec2-like protein [Anaerofustis stercorihominis DSM 17244]
MLKFKKNVEIRKMDMSIKRPAVIIFLYILYGLLMSYFNVANIIFFTLLFISFVMLFIIFRDNSLRIIFMICIFLGTFTFFHTSYRLDYISDLDKFTDDNISITAKVVSAPSYKEKTTWIYVKDVKYELDGKIYTSKDKLQIVIYNDNGKYKVGSYYRFYGKVKHPIALKDFNYNLFLRTLNVYNYMNVNYKNIDFVMEDHFPFYLDKAFVLRDRYRSNLEINMKSEDNVNLLMGMLFSEKNVDDETYANFKITGLSHVLAVSGLHVGLIYAVIVYFLSMFDIKKRYRVFIIAPVLFIYVMLAGMSFSATRAMMLCLFNEVLSMKHEEDNDPFNHTFIIASILLLINPLSIFHVSFQLSFSAVMGIFLLSPVMRNKLLDVFNEDNNIVKYFIELFCISTSAYLFTLPIIINTFGAMSVISILCNLIIVPFIAPIIIMGLIGGLSGRFVFGYIVLNLLDMILTFIRRLVKILASVPFASVSVGHLNIVVLFLYYTLLLIFAGYITISKKKKSEF